jgi:hypothetical protein
MSLFKANGTIDRTSKEWKELIIPNHLKTRDKTEYCYILKHNLSQVPLCPICKEKYLKYISWSIGFKKSCSKKCQVILSQENLKKAMLEKYGVENTSQLKSTKDKKKKSSLEKYGVENPMQANVVRNKQKENLEKKYGVDNISKLDSIKEKKKETTMKHYGVTSPMKSEEIKVKQKETVKRLYGVDNVSQSEKIKKKKEETTLLNWGVKNPFQSEEIKSKIMELNMKNYGVKHSSQRKDVIKSRLLTNLEKYGSICSLNNPIIKEKARKTWLDKYNVDHFSQSHILNYDKLNKDYIEKNFVKDGIIDIDIILKFYNISRNTLDEKLRGLKVKYKRRKFYRSRTQDSIYKYISSLIQEDVLSDRTDIIKIEGKKFSELDIYIPSKKLAIEYNGLIFHSFGLSNYSLTNNAHMEYIKKNDHTNKTNASEELGIQLLHINENEWLDPIKQRIWKSVIKSKLGVLENKIFARKCEIKRVSYKESFKFLTENHLQGNVNGSYNIGLYYQDELVSLMIFSKSRYEKNSGYELLRFCSKVDHNVIGAGSKLLKRYKEDIGEDLISYGNRRWTSSLNNFYQSNGFEYVHTSKPGWKYFKENDIYTLYDRVQFQKHKLKNLFEQGFLSFYDENLTTDQNIYLNGYRKIYDSGNLKYILRKEV